MMSAECGVRNWRSVWHFECRNDAQLTERRNGAPNDEMTTPMTK